MEIIWLFIIIWFTVVITHALTKAGIPTNKVVEVRFIERTSQLHIFKDDFIIEPSEMTYFSLNPSEMIERQFYKSKHRIVDALPNSFFEFTQTEDRLNNSIHCSTRLIIMPPKKH